MRPAIKLASVLQDLALSRMAHASRMVVLLILIVKFAMTPEELPSVSNVLVQPTDFWLFLNTSVNVMKVSLTNQESASHAHQVVLNVLTPPFANDALSQPLPTSTAELVLALKATSSPLSH